MPGLRHLLRQQQLLPLLHAAPQYAVARKMRQQEFHLVGQYSAPLQVDVLGVGRGEGYGQQLHARLFRGAACLVVIAALAGRDHIRPGVAAALAERLDVVARQHEVGKLQAAIQAQGLVPAEQRLVAERRGIPAGKEVGVGMVSGAGDYCIDFDCALHAGDGIDSAANPVERAAQGIAHLVQRDQPDGFLVTDPFQGHAGNIGSQNLLL